MALINNLGIVYHQYCSSSATPSRVQSQIALLLSNKDSESVHQAIPINDPIIVQGMRNKKRILEDYQTKFGKDSNDLIVTRKKGKISNDLSLDRS
jgi:hypothetical protein